LNKTYSWRKALKDPLYFSHEFLEIEPESPEAPAIRNLIPHLEKMIKQEE